MDVKTLIPSNTSVLDDLAIKGALTRSTSKPVEEACTICLDPITERAITTPCNHVNFDFLCLVSWLDQQSTCPLCKTRVTKVEYDFRGPADYKTYHVPEAATSSSTEIGTRRQILRRPRPLPRHLWIPIGQSQSPSVDTALERRREVYRKRLYSLRVGTNRVSKYQDITCADFSGSPELQSRCRTFLRRELQIFSFLDSDRNRDFLIEYIVAVLRSNELRACEELIKDFLGLDNARQLLHELEAWLRSPYTSLRHWDEHVQYADTRACHKN